MYAHGHRPVAPGRFSELFESLKAEYETLSTDASVYKHRAEDAERKLQLQLQEMTNIQNQIVDLERTFQKMKTVYEGEIIQLRRQVEALGASPVSLDPNRAPPVFPPSASTSNSATSIVSANAAAQAASNTHLAGSPAGATPLQSGKSTPIPPNAPVVSKQPRFPPDAIPGSLPPPLIPGASKLPAGMPSAMMPPSGSVIPGAPAGQAMFHPHHMMDTLVYPGLMRQYDLAAVAAAAAANGGLPAVVKQQPAQPGIDPSLTAAVVAVAGSNSTPNAPRPPSSQPPANISGTSQAPSFSTTQSTASSTLPSKKPSAQTPESDTGETAASAPAAASPGTSEWNVTFNPNVKKQLDISLSHDLDHSSVVCCVKFSPNGRYLATGCKQSAQMYDVETGKKLQTFIDTDPRSQTDPYIRSVCFSPDGMTLATGAEDRTIKLWDVQSGSIRHNLQGHELDIYSLDYSKDGRLIVSGSGDRRVKIWDAESGRLLHNLGADDVGPKDGVTSVAFSPDGRYVAAGSLDRVVRIWDVQTGYFIDRFEGHSDSVYSVAFDPEGKTVASGSLDKTLRLWDVSSRSRSRCRHTFVGHKDFVLSVAFSNDGSWIASGSKDRYVNFWDPRTANLLMTLHGHKNSVISVAVCAAGNPEGASSGKGWFATGSGDHRARIWSFSSAASNSSASPAAPALGNASS